MPEIHRALAHKELLPSEHLVDAGYPDSEILADSPREHGVQVIGPAAPDTAWQAQTEGAFDVACFTIDWEQQRAICPPGHASIHWSPSKDNRGKDMINIQFSCRDCQVCPQRAVCTTSRNGRRLSVRPKEQHIALQAARQFQETPEFKERYNARAGVEGALSQGIRVCDLRHARYIGLAKTHLQQVLTATALNVTRATQWLDGAPLAKTRHAPFLALMPKAA